MFAFQSIWNIRPRPRFWALSTARDHRGRRLARHAAAVDPRESLGRGGLRALGQLASTHVVNKLRPSAPQAKASPTPSSGSPTKPKRQSRADLLGLPAPVVPLLPQLVAVLLDLSKRQLEARHLGFSGRQFEPGDQGQGPVHKGGCTRGSQIFRYASRREARLVSQHV